MLASANIRVLGYIQPLVLTATPTIQKLNKTLYDVSLCQHPGTDVIGTHGAQENDQLQDPVIISRTCNTQTIIVQSCLKAAGIFFVFSIA